MNAPHPGLTGRRFSSRRWAAAFLVIALRALTPEDAAAHGVTRYDNGLWFDGAAFQARTVYSVEGVLAFDHQGDVDRVVDLGSGYAIPPFGDAHSHALAGPDFSEEQERFLAAGTFYVSNPNCIDEWAQAARVKSAAPETVDVRYALGGLTSAGGHPIQIYDGVADQVPRWTRESMEGKAYFVVDDEAGLERQWPRVLAGRPDFIKVYLQRSEFHGARKADAAYYGKRALDPALIPKIVTRAHAAGLRVSAHVTSAADFVTAVRAGVDEIAHLPLEPLTAEIAAETAERGTTVVTTTLSHRPTDRVADVDALHRGNLRLLRGHGVRLVLGTDSHATVLQEARNVARLMGLQPVELLALLTDSTPRWIFPERKIGRLAPGHESSFLVLEADPLEDPGALTRIRARVKSGHLLEAAAAALPSPAGPLLHLAMSAGVDAIIAEYRRLRRVEGEAWDFSEQPLNQVGYALMGHDRIADAIAIFRLNVEMFPEAANPYDSLAEAYLKSGDRERARVNYRRSLELNPHNAGAREKLQELERP